MIFPARFKGRTAIITGGGSGIGRSVATRLISEGARVSLWDMNHEALISTQGETHASHIHALDITDSDQVAHAMDASASALGGKLDLLVTSAGISGPNVAARDYSLDAWRRVIDVNLNDLFYCNRAAIPHMERNSYGRIVNVASVAGKEGNPNASAYSASKAAVIGLTKSLGKELARTEIRVNCVALGAVRTAIFDQMEQQHVEFMLSKIPMGRFGTLDEMSSLICWLLSEESSFSTGAVFDASGGRATY
jgi:NAD(P)-dependent dehydrogenase (short-subunit alcohol dehydrogenase family)